MKVIIKQPGMAAELKEIPNTLASLQHEVGGYIETVNVGTDLVAIVNEEGRLKKLPDNTLGLVGTIVFVGYKKDRFTSVPDSAVSLLCACRAQKEAHP